MVVPPNTPKLEIFSRKTHGCWVPPFWEAPEYIDRFLFPLTDMLRFFQQQISRKRWLQWIKRLQRIKSHRPWNWSTWKRPSLPPMFGSLSALRLSSNAFWRLFLTFFDIVWKIWREQRWMAFYYKFECFSLGKLMERGWKWDVDGEEFESQGQSRHCTECQLGHPLDCFTR